MENDNLKDLFIKDQPHGSLTLAEVAQHLGLSEDYVRNSMKHSLTSYESSDRQLYFEPYSVQKAGERINRYRAMIRGKK